MTDPLFALGRDAINVASGPSPQGQTTSTSKIQNNKDTNNVGVGSIQSVLNKESDSVTQHVAHKIKVLQVRMLPDRVKVNYKYLFSLT